MIFKSCRFMLEYLYNDWRSITASLTLYFTKKLTFYFHMRHTLVISISTFYWFSNKQTGNKNRENVKIRKCIFKTVKFENVYYHKMYFKLYYNMKFIIPRTWIKLPNEICNTAQNCAAKCATCCTIKFIEKLNFLCVLILLNRQKINFTSSIKYSSY